MNDELIERVARAIRIGCGADDWDDLGKAAKEAYRQVAQAALAALKPLDRWGERGPDMLYVMTNRQYMAVRNKSGCCCQIDEEAGDEIVGRCALHADDRRQAAEETREQCIQHCRTYPSKPGWQLADEIDALPLEPGE